MTVTDPETKALQDAIFASKVRRARQMPMSEKLAAGPLLFDQSMQMMRGAIQSEHPEYSVADVEREMRRRLKIAKLIDDAGIYQPAGMIDEQPRSQSAQFSMRRPGTCSK